jgi:hypothetical protein
MEWRGRPFSLPFWPSFGLSFEASDSALFSKRVWSVEEPFRRKKWGVSTLEPGGSGALLVRGRLRGPVWAPWRDPS